MNLTLDLNGTRTSTRISQYQIQDTISYPITTKRKRL